MLYTVCGAAECEDIDYREEPDPRLSRDDGQWADGLLRDQGRR
jgi:hypothetical protein